MHHIRRTIRPLLTLACALSLASCRAVPDLAPLAAAAHTLRDASSAAALAVASAIDVAASAPAAPSASPCAAPAPAPEALASHGATLREHWAARDDLLSALADYADALAAAASAPQRASDAARRILDGARALLVSIDAPAPQAHHPIATLTLALYDEAARQLAGARLEDALAATDPIVRHALDMLRLDLDALARMAGAAFDQREMSLRAAYACDIHRLAALRAQLARVDPSDPADAPAHADLLARIDLETTSAWHADLAGARALLASRRSGAADAIAAAQALSEEWAIAHARAADALRSREPIPADRLTRLTEEALALRTQLREESRR